MMREFRFMLRDRSVWVWLSLAFLFSVSAVTLGLNEVREQRAEIAELRQLDQIEREVALNGQSDWGSAAYYTFHVTYDPPSDFAFAAIGQRDVSPWKHRIRMLALEGQIYETDANNPDFALIGRFDFAFIASLIAPLLVILLLFDLRSGEQVAGRLRLIEASAAKPNALWRTRAGLRVGGLALALCLPVLIGGLISGTSILTLLLSIMAVCLYLTFWTALTLWLTPAIRTGAYNLTVMLGVWLLLCAVVPATLTQAISRVVPLPDGGEIVLTQREVVNGAWDTSKEATFEPFIERHPELADYTALESDSFEWKWYYAFQQVGDQTAEPLSQAYRTGQERRDKLAMWSSLVSPATLLQRTMENLASTDTRAAIAYDQSIRDYHAYLRDWHYPKIFKYEDFDAEWALGALPVFDPAIETGAEHDLSNDGTN
jgi:ABC-2 type transport system permease protein